MDKNVHIRLATLDDAAVLVGFNKAMALETEKKMLDDEQVMHGVRNLILNQSYGFYVVAEKEGIVAGSLMVTSEWSDWRNGIFWWIQSVYVRPECRKQGIYKCLYLYLKNKAESQPSVCGFRLYVERNNIEAQKVYTALGMQETAYKMFEEDIR